MRAPSISGTLYFILIIKIKASDSNLSLDTSKFKGSKFIMENLASVNNLQKQSLMKSVTGSGLKFQTMDIRKCCKILVLVCDQQNDTCPM